MARVRSVSAGVMVLMSMFSVSDRTSCRQQHRQRHQEFHEAAEAIVHVELGAK
jgi:hypothetical protein